MIVSSSFKWKSSFFSCRASSSTSCAIAETICLSLNPGEKNSAHVVSKEEVQSFGSFLGLHFFPHHISALQKILHDPMCMNQFDDRKLNVNEISNPLPASNCAFIVLYYRNWIHLQSALSPLHSQPNPEAASQQLNEPSSRNEVHKQKYWNSRKNTSV